MKYQVMPFQEKNTVQADNLMNNLYNQVKSYLRINTDLEERRYGFKDACSRLVELDETIQLPTGYKLAGNGKRRQCAKFCTPTSKVPSARTVTKWCCTKS